jgi:phosphoenolpyruvate carboxykinase (ATP)
VAKLTREQAMYHFLSGYTAKVAGTEAGVTEPQATFSPCFGAPFMALPPSTYAQLLGDRISKHTVDVWLVNTGWSGGPYGVGQRIKLPVTRAIVKAVLDGELKNVERKQDPIFGMQVPASCPEVPSEVLEPRKTWKDTAAYDRKARDLATMFEKNFKEEASDAPAEVREAGPKV